MNAVTRRFFLGATAVAATGISRRLRAAANEKVTVGVIGLGGQGRAHVESYRSLPNVEVAYVCDLDDGRVAKAKEGMPGLRAVNDLRRLLDDRSVDAVSIATPDHWHTPAALLALSAGKHVYVEKPCCHNVREGRMLVEAAKRTGLMVQHGTQSRSAPLILRAIELLHDGAIGDVMMARAWNVQFRPPIGKAQPGEPPAGFDYANWLGPAPVMPFQSNRHHYTWHWWYALGSGDAGNDGVHEIDIARWGLGVDTHPSQVAAVGGKYVHDDDQQFADTITAAFEYPGNGGVGQRRQLQFEMRLWSRYHPHKIDNGNEFLGTRGRLLLTKRGRLELFNEGDEPVSVELPENRNVSLPLHHANFVDAIRSGSPLHADALTGHLSSTLPHLANLACRVGRSFQFDPASETIERDEEANRLLGREYNATHWSAPRTT